VVREFVSPKMPSRQKLAQVRSVRAEGSRSADATQRSTSTRWWLHVLPTRLAHGPDLRVLAVIDDQTGEILAIEPYVAQPDTDITRSLDLASRHGRRPHLCVSVRQEDLTSQAVSDWSDARDVAWQYGSARKVLIPSRSQVLARLHHDLLDRTHFFSLPQVREALAAWRTRYNAALTARPATSTESVSPRDREGSPAVAAPPLPETGFLRLKQIIGDPTSDPPLPALIPISKSSWWAGVRSGRYPRPVEPRLAPRITAWRVEDIKLLITRGVPGATAAACSGVPECFGVRSLLALLLLHLSLATIAPHSADAQTVTVFATDGMFRTEVSINGRASVRALIDTGSSSVLICQAMASELQLKRGDAIQIATVGETLEAYRTILAQVRIDTIEMHDVGAIVTHAPLCEEPLIGNSVLRRLRGALLQGDKLTLIGSNTPLSRGMIQKFNSTKAGRGRD
jgi:prophage regulatory protein